MTSSLFPVALLITSLFCIGCTASVRYSENDGTWTPAARESNRDSIEYRETLPDDDVRVETTKDPDEEPLDENLNDTDSEAQIDRALMNRIISQYLEVPYEKGGSGKLGLDCSGLVYVVYRDYDGTRTPLSVESLYRLDERVDYDELTYGDLIFFRIDDRRVSHVGIYLGNQRFVHSSEARGVVIDRLDDEYFATRFAGARRVR